MQQFFAAGFAMGAGKFSEMRKSYEQLTKQTGFTGR